MNPTTERELKLDLNTDVTRQIIQIIPELAMLNGWPCKSKIEQVNYDRYFDQLLTTNLFLLYSQESYVRVRKSVWPETKREAEFIAYRKLTEASYGKPAEIYDNEISVLKIREITDQLIKDHSANLREPAKDSIGAVEHLESMGLSEIIRLKCERTVYPIAYSDNQTDLVKVKVDKVTYKNRPNDIFTQVEIDYYSAELFDLASRMMQSITMAIKDLSGAVPSFSSTSKMARGIQLL